MFLTVWLELFTLCLNHRRYGGHNNTVVTHSPPTSEVSGSNPGPYVGKLVVFLPMVSSFTVQNLDTSTVCTGFLRPQKLPFVICPVQCWKRHQTPNKDRRYILQLEVLLGSRTAFKDTTYLPRLGVSFTLQVAITHGYRRVVKCPCPSATVQDSYVTLRHNGETSIYLHSPYVSPCYIDRRPSDNLTYTMDYTPSVAAARNSFALIRLRMSTVRNSEEEILSILKLPQDTQGLGRWGGGGGTDYLQTDVRPW